MSDGQVVPDSRRSSDIPESDPQLSEKPKGVVSKRPVHIGMVAGEASGDILGSGLIEAIRKRYPNAVFEGIGGPLMLAQGFKSFVPMERLSVMGLVEVLGRIFELIGIRRRIRRYFLQKKPDVFVGIDAPDFNLGLELKLRKGGIKTSHYVSPSVWAWRQKRVFKIARAVDLMLTLFPFEARFYRDHQIAVRFVGHPLADAIPLHPERYKARAHFGLNPDERAVAILPGSRAGEIAYIGASFIESAKWIHERDPSMRFLLPCINEARRDQVQTLINELAPNLPVQVILGQSREVMAASDAVMLASGTATLEGMLLKRPMVVAYRVSRITHFIMKRLLKAPFISLPNLLAGRELVPELIQDAAQPEQIGKQVLACFEPATNQRIQESFLSLHQQLQQNASEQAADALVELIESGSVAERVQ